MKRWARILPLWIVRWYALKWMERAADENGCIYVKPWPDVRIYVSKRYSRTEAFYSVECTDGNYKSWYS